MIISLIIRLLIVVVAQIVVFANMRLGLYFIPLVYLYVVISYPFEMKSWQTLLISFGVGLVIDLFMGTPGLNSAAILLSTFSRYYFAKTYGKGKELERWERPSIKGMGLRMFLRFSTLIVFIHCSAYFLLENFGFSNLLPLLFTILGSTFINVVLVLMMDLLFTNTITTRK